MLTLSAFPRSPVGVLRGERRRFAAAFAAGLALSSGCGEAPPPEGARAVLLITLDTFRADITGTGGNPDMRTPHLDRLARRSVQWSRAVSPIPLTTPSHATILSGQTPGAHGVLKNRMVLPEDVPTVAKILDAAGYRTGAVVSRSAVLAARFGLAHGFDQYDVVEPEDRPSRSDGPRTTEVARRWLKKRGGPGSFLWVHYFDAHIPYLPPEPYHVLYDPDYDGEFYMADWPIQEHFRREEVTARDVSYQAALYASEVTFLDACVGRLLEAPELEDAVILLTADHGEGLWEHERYFGHDTLLFDTALRVPLFLAGAGETGVRSESVATPDVAPTLLELCGMDPPGEMSGVDLLGSIPEGRRLLVETHPTREKGGAVYGIRTDAAKVIWSEEDGRARAYDLSADPRERTDLGSEAGGIYGELAEELRAALDARDHGDLKTVDDEAGGMDAATLEAMQTLGYVE